MWAQPSLASQALAQAPCLTGAVAVPADNLEWAGCT